MQSEAKQLCVVPPGTNQMRWNASRDVNAEIPRLVRKDGGVRNGPPMANARLQRSYSPSLPNL